MAKKKARRVPVSERALIQRIRRKLAQEGYRGPYFGDRLFKTRQDRPNEDGAAELGEFYTVSTRSNFVNETHIDLEKMGREVGALADYEELAD